jgi:hypothetical protein
MRIKKDDYFNAHRRPKAIVIAGKISDFVFSKNETR